MNQITLVTGLWDIGRDKLQDGWYRSFEHYLSKFDDLLKLNVNLIIFGEEKLYDFVFRRRNHDNTQFITRDTNWFKNEFYEKIQQIRLNPEWFNQVGWLAESTQAKLDMYNPLVMSKMFLLHDAKIIDSFNSKYMFWIDAGLTNTVHPGYFANDKVLEKLPKYVNNFHFVCFPYETTTEIHGFEINAMNGYCKKNVNRVARGGFFGGKKDVIGDINSIYYQLLSETLSRNLMGTEESIFTIMTYLYPNLISYSMINGDGLMWKFFEDIKDENLSVLNDKEIFVSQNKNDITKVGLYVLTFNSPNQFETLIKSMMEYDSDFVSKPRKFLLDNSTDLSTTTRYLELCEQYGFEHIKKDNIGIMGGRIFIAEHFNQTDLDFYYFFEDDMFFYPRNEVCKNGFNRYVNGLYKKSLEIIEKENFDFLKLNYTEFFGDNGTQWAWYNVPQDFRQKHWVNKPTLPTMGYDPDAPKTKFNNIKNHKGLPYIDGEIFLCNWPIIMDKKGNYKCYLETRWAHPFEQTLMSHAYQEMIRGNLKPGLLLLTPTEHNRFEHYVAELRKEN